MIDSIDKYLNKSKENLNIILSYLETNIEFLDNDLWNDYNEIKNTIKNIINIYYDNYYLYTGEFLKIDKYIKFNNKISRRLKTILLAIIDYYESKNEEYVIREKEGTILYLTILIYVSNILYEKDFNLIDNPKKIEKVINNIIDNFARIRFKREKDLVTLINNIKSIVEKNNEFNKLINNLNCKDSHNIYIRVNNNYDFYKVIYEYNIKELENYEERDINIVNKKLNISSILTKLSFDLTYITTYKVMKNGKNCKFLFPISKGNLIDKDIRDSLIKDNKINHNIKFLINYNEIKNDYEFINLMKQEGIDIYIEVNENLETNNYNMFMDIKNILVSEEFISVNDKYVEIWKDMGMNFIIKNLGERLLENNLVSRK